MVVDADADGIIDKAARTDPVADQVRALARELAGADVAGLIARAFEMGEVDGATVLALVMLAQGTPPPREAVERIFPDSIDDRAGRALVASHPDALEILESLLGSRRLDRYQLASAAALLTHLWPKTQGDAPWPARLLEILRSLARARAGWVGEHFARQAALRARDAHIDQLYQLDRKKEKVDEELFRDLGEVPGIDSLAAARSNVIASGFTARRIAPKVGRNDACHCGSGKKYKKCCATKDRAEVLSPVAGLTMREYQLRLGEFLGADELRKEHPADLARLSLEALDTDQVEACFTVFLDCERMVEAEHALEVLATRELPPDLTMDELRAELVMIAHDWGLDDVVERNLPKITDVTLVPPQIALGRELRKPTEQVLAVIERECRDALVEGKHPPMTIAYELIEPYPALGIVVARGCLSPEHPEDSYTLLEEIEWARDRLGATPDDPYWAVWDLMVDERRLAKVADVEKEAMRKELEAMREEARDARAEAQVRGRELGKYQSQLDALEEKASEAERRSLDAKTTAEKATAARDAEAARRLRQKIRELEGRIREGHDERAELRRRAEELASQRVSGDAGPSEEEALDEAPVDEPAATPHGLRVPVWSDKARASLERLPKNIVSSAIATSGALGAGRPEAWRHAKRLEGMHGLCSARVGIHHRLLYRMDTEDTLDVEEVVSREDLDRALAARR